MPTRHKLLTLKEIAELAGARVIGNGEVMIHGVSTIMEAGEGEITFLSNPIYRRYLKECNASAIIVKEGTSPDGKNLLVHKNPYLIFARVMELFFPSKTLPPGISKLALIEEGVEIGADVGIGPFVHIESGTILGKRVAIYTGVYIGEGVRVGDDSLLYPGVCVMDGCIIGRRVILHPGVVIGSDGFGYARDDRNYVKIRQSGIVEIGDDVEIGANTTIDRAALGVTRIGPGTKIDNLVQIGHNVTIGANCAVVALVGIAGSASLGENVALGGQVGVGGHLRIGDNVMVGAKSGINRDIPSDKIMSGFPPIEHNIWLKAAATFSRLPEMRRDLNELKKRLKRMEGMVGKK